MSRPLKIVFAGTSVFSAQYLDALLAEGFNITAVLTRSDKPAGRGQKLSSSSVKELALANNLILHQPKTLKSAEAIELFKSLRADVVVDVAYGLIVPQNILGVPKFGFINVHPSLLPRWRGPSPIQYTILNGDVDAGVTIMQLDAGVDTGPILLQKKYTTQPNETSESLMNNLSKLGVNALITVLKDLQKNGRLNLKPQYDHGACYAPKIEKEDGRINWRKPAAQLDRKIRAFNPKPVAYAMIGDEQVKIWKATPLSNYTSEEPGSILGLNKDSIDVATGDGILRLQELQFPGGKRLPISAILNSKKRFFRKASNI